jgi:hypothetical protein
MRMLVDLLLYFGKILCYDGIMEQHYLPSTARPSLFAGD